MSNYKLKKWYPSLPRDWEVGMEIKPMGDMWNKYIPISSTCKYHQILSNEINNPEFWEKVVEKDYEVLSFDYTCNKTEWGWFAGYTQEGKNSWKDQTWMSKYYNITSVKRLSDNLVFTIGDKIDGISYKNITINNIWLNPNCLSQILFNHKDEGIALSSAKKSKQPLFTTEDGVDIYEGMEVIVIHPTTLNTIIGSKAIEYSSYKGWLKFYTKEKAEEYILMNKPCLCLNDIKGYLIEGDELELKRLVKSKLNENK